MSDIKVPPVSNPTMDLGEQLTHLLGDTGGLEQSMGGYRIQVYHTRAFPWDDVFKLLLYRDFKVYVTHKKADLFIEARP